MVFVNLEATMVNKMRTGTHRQLFHLRATDLLFHHNTVDLVLDRKGKLTIALSSTVSWFAMHVVEVVDVIVVFCV